MRNRKRISIRARDGVSIVPWRAAGGFGRPCPQREVVERVAARWIGPRVKASGALLSSSSFSHAAAPESLAASPRRPLRRGPPTSRLLRNKSGRGHPSGLATRSTSLSFFPFDRSRGSIARLALLSAFPNRPGDGIEPASSLFQAGRFLKKRRETLLFRICWILLLGSNVCR